MTQAWIVGSGLAAATCAYELRETIGMPSFIFEKSQRWGGLVRSDRMDGVIYEPHGSHILHTEDEEVWNLLNKMAPFNNYRHTVQTMVRGEKMTWPIQKKEITALYGPGRDMPNFMPGQYNFDPAKLNFEQWCLQIMSPEVYEDFIKPYTEKQWGMPANKLAADFAPKRVQVRDDGDVRLFKDPFQGFPDGEQDATWDDVIRGLMGPSLGDSYLQTGIRVSLKRLENLLSAYPQAWRPDVVVITVPLDEFAGDKYGKMDWRGLTFDHKHVADPTGGFVQERMVVNWPGKEFPWIRTHETKHASRQRVRGTVLTTEYPGGPGKYYPVPGVGGKNRTRNIRYQQFIRNRIEKLGPQCLFVGRLASFAYMDTDDVVRQGLDTVRSFVAGKVAA